MNLLTMKSLRITRAKTEAAERIYKIYPLYAQINAALGVYDSLPLDDSFQKDNMKAGIQAIIDAEHAAETAINNLTTSEDVDAFTW